MEYAVTIDPSIRSAGVAIWKWSEPTWGNLAAPIRTQLWTLSSDLVKPGVPWVRRVNTMLIFLDRLIKELGPDRVRFIASELPQFFQSQGGLMVAARGDLAKLEYVVGAFAGLCFNYTIPFRPVPVADWKGQLPKPAVIHRISRMLKCSENKYTKDEWDAVGIGLYLKGHFK